MSLKTSLFLAEIPSSASTFGANFDPNDVKCELCDEEEEATFRCNECDQFIGPRCAVTHGRSKLSAQHHLQPIGEYFAKSEGKKVSAPAKQVSRCGEHPTLEVDTYCKTCKAVICLKCLAAAHSGHLFCPLSEESENLKGELIDMTSSIAVRVREAGEGMNTLAQSLGKLEEGRQCAEGDLRKAFTSLRETIDSREAEMLGKLDDRAHGVKKAIEQEKGETEFAFAEFRGFIEMNESLLVAGSDVEVATGHPMVFLLSFPFLFFPFLSFDDFFPLVVHS